MLLQAFGMPEKVALLDFGAQLERVIIRRILEDGRECVKFSGDVSADDLKREGVEALVLSGGPGSVQTGMLPDPRIYQMGLPIMGICYGMQVIAHQLGGKVMLGEKGQYGRKDIVVQGNSPMFKGTPNVQRVLMSHFDKVVGVPDGFSVDAVSDDTNAAMSDPTKRIAAFQFHPEMVPVTVHGQQMFTNFFRDVCKFPDRPPQPLTELIEEAGNIIETTIGSDGHIMWYLSGGVDSMTAAALSMRHVDRDRLHARFLQNDFMREGEMGEVVQWAHELKIPDFKVLDVTDVMYNTKMPVQLKKGKPLEVIGPLTTLTHPQEKRKLFSAIYFDIAAKEMEKIARELGIPKEKMFLGQGTLRPDMIETGDKRATKGGGAEIKHHHNIGWDGPKIEPMVNLFKDQVRPIALTLGLPEEIAYRQPFPGPGMIPRVVCIQEQPVIGDDFRKVDEKVGALAGKYGFKGHILPVKTVGQQGDQRSYKYAVVLCGETNWEAYQKAHLAIPDQVPEVNRVMYLSGEPLTLDECVQTTPTLITPEVTAMARKIDAIAREVAGKYGYNDSRKCSQGPNSIMPLALGVPGARMSVQRHVYTHDFMAIIGMTPAESAPPEERIPEELFLETAERIKRECPYISRHALDGSDKPPASTELE